MKVLQKKNKFAVYIFQSIYIVQHKQIIAECKEENLSLGKWHEVKEISFTLDNVLSWLKKFEKKIKFTKPFSGKKKSKNQIVSKPILPVTKIKPIEEKPRFSFMENLRVVRSQKVDEIHLRLVNQPINAYSFTTTTLLGRFPIGTHINDVYTWVNKERERLKLPLFKREVVSFNISTLTHTFMPKKIKAGQMKLRK
jgi:hypothetical protein